MPVPAGGCRSAAEMLPALLPASAAPPALVTLSMTAAAGRAQQRRARAPCCGGWERAGLLWFFRLCHRRSQARPP